MAGISGTVVVTMRTKVRFQDLEADINRAINSVFTCSLERAKEIAKVDYAIILKIQHPELK